MRSSFDAALHTLARAARLEIAQGAIEQARETCGVRSFSIDGWGKDLARVGEAIGIRVRALDLSVRDLFRGQADDLMPLVRLEERSEGVTCVTLLERTNGRVRVTLGDDPTELTLDERALSAFLSVGADAPIVWTTGDPCTSLGTQPGTFPGHTTDAHHPSPIERLYALVKLERDDLGVVVVYAACVGLLALATPLGVQFLVNTVAFGALLQPLVVLTLLVLTGLVIETLLEALKSWVIERIQQRVFVRTGLELAFRLPRVRQTVLDERHAPELVNRFFDVVALQKGAATLLSDGVSIVLSAMVGMLILAFYHPFLLAFDVVLLVALALVIFVVGRRAIPTSIDESAAKYAVAAWLEEAATHRSALALGDGPGYVEARAESLTREWLTRRKAHWRIVFRQLTSALALRAFASAALLGLGGWLVLSRQLSLGQLVAAELIVSTVVAGFAKFGKAFESFYDLATATDKLGHLVDLDLVRTAGTELPPKQQGLEIALRAERIELDLAAGTHTVIYGAGGAGKSRLADIVSGVREPSRGELVVDGMPATDLAPAAIRSVVAVVRDAEIFEGTLFENLALGRPEIDRARARAALRDVGLDEFVRDLPNGIDTPLPSHARALGTTVGILITVARALAGSARLLILDGALDRLDNDDRRTVWAAATARPWTVLMTTSRRELLDLSESSWELADQRLQRAA